MDPFQTHHCDFHDFGHPENHKDSGPQFAINDSYLSRMDGRADGSTRRDIDGIRSSKHHIINCVDMREDIRINCTKLQVAASEYGALQATGN